MFRALVWRSLLEKYLALFFCGNLMYFNEARLNEATLNLHTHAWIFSRLSIASVDGKEHLSEVVFSDSSRIFIVHHEYAPQKCPPSPTWCCVAQETRVVVNRQLAPSSWQCSSTFLRFFGKNETPVIRQAPYSPDSRPRWSRGNVLASRSKVRGFKPGWGRWIFSGRKNPEHKSSGRDFKLGIRSLRFQAR